MVDDSSVKNRQSDSDKRRAGVLGRKKRKQKGSDHRRTITGRAGFKDSGLSPHGKKHSTAYQKGKKVEEGICRLADSKEYLAEVTYRDPHTRKRIRERKTVSRLDLARGRIRSRKTDADRREIRRDRKRGAPRPFVFCNAEGKPISGDIRGGFETSSKLAGIASHIRIHDLRHTFASHLIMAGKDIRTVARLLGHRDIRMTLRYAHPAPDHLQAAVDALTEQASNHQAQQSISRSWLSWCRKSDAAVTHTGFSCFLLIKPG